MLSPDRIAGMLASPLLAEQQDVRPFEDAGSLLGDPAGLRAFAEERGYFFFPGLVPPQQVAAVRARARQLCDGYGWFEPDQSNPPIVRPAGSPALQGRGFDDPRWVELQQKMNDDDGFCGLGRIPAVLDTLAAVYGEPAAAARTHILWVKLPGSPQHTTRPHQDLFYVPQVPDLWTAWMPLVDTPMEVGPLAVIPGSHRLCRWEHIDALTGIATPRDVSWASGPVRAGDAVLFAAGTVHCAWSNVAPDRVRLSADVRFHRSSTEPLL